MASGATILLFALFAGVLSAASHVVYVYLPELFPTDLRAFGIELAIARHTACALRWSHVSSF